MTGAEILQAINATALCIANDEPLDEHYSAAFASDLMSDALMLIQSSPEKTVLITGLANPQSLNTAEMLDINLIILVRDKQLDEEILKLAVSKRLNIFGTHYTMFETCGILYEKGLGAIHVA